MLVSRWWYQSGPFRRIGQLATGTPNTLSAIKINVLLFILPVFLCFFFFLSRLEGI